MKILSEDPPTVEYKGIFYIEGIGEIEEEELKEDWRGWKPDKDCKCSRCVRVRPEYWT